MVVLNSEVYREDLEYILGAEYPWVSLTGRRILVTGATGMVGSILVDVLASKMREFEFEVVAMSRSKTDLDALFSCYYDDELFAAVPHDVNQPLPVLCDTVFHCASNTHPFQYSTDPIGTITTNVIGLNNLLDMASRSSGGRFVFLSSVEVYGQSRGDVDSFDESYCGNIDCNTVRAAYNEAKRVGESLCQAYAAQRGLDFVIPRLSRLYGPSMRLSDTKASSQFIMNAVRGEDIVLKSSGSQCFSYCYAADAVSAILHLLFYGKSGEAYNVAGSETDTTIRSLAECLASLAGTEVVYELADSIESRGYSVANHAVLNTGKINSLGWFPRYSLKDGLSRTVSSLVSSQRGREGQ